MYSQDQQILEQCRGLLHTEHQLLPLLQHTGTPGTGDPCTHQPGHACQHHSGGGDDAHLLANDQACSDCRVHMAARDMAQCLSQGSHGDPKAESNPDILSLL